jgi:hypothetical protein
MTIPLWQISVCVRVVLKKIGTKISVSVLWLEVVPGMGKGWSYSRLADSTKKQGSTSCA